MNDERKHARCASIAIPLLVALFILTTVTLILTGMTLRRVSSITPMVPASVTSAPTAQEVQRKLVGSLYEVDDFDCNDVDVAVNGAIQIFCSSLIYKTPADAGSGDASLAVGTSKAYCVTVQFEPSPSTFFYQECHQIYEFNGKRGTPVGSLAITGIYREDLLGATYRDELWFVTGGSGELEGYEGVLRVPVTDTDYYVLQFDIQRK